MGCDIHMYMEYRDPNNSAYNRWNSFGSRYNVGRNYDMFALLAGVRGSSQAIVAPRGYPADADYETDQEYYYYIDEEEGFCSGRRTITQETALRWNIGIEYDDKGNPYRTRNPDAHTPSWLTRSEFMSAIVMSELNHRHYIIAGADMSEHLRNMYVNSLGSYIFKYKALASSMTSLEQSGYKTRIVFWFDN